MIIIIFLLFQHDFRVHQTDDESREGAADDEDDGDDDDDKSTSQLPSSPSQTDLYSNKNLSQKEPSDSVVVADSSDKLVVDISDIDSCKYLQIASLNSWDYPIFEAASLHSNCILSKVCIIKKISLNDNMLYF
jgi:hypothetical protein